MIENPFQTVYVPVSSVNHWSDTKQIKQMAHKKLAFGHFSMTGMIEDGNWDKKGEGLENDYHMVAFKERFFEGKPWEETVYKYTKGRLDSGEIQHRWCRTWEEYERIHLRRWDKLFEDIKTKGYKKQSVIHSLLGDYEVEVVVTRHGEVLLYEGRHRMVLAKLLQQDKIPVMVTVWHKEFLDSVAKAIKNQKMTPEVAIQYSLHHSLHGAMTVEEAQQ